MPAQVRTLPPAYKKMKTGPTNKHTKELIEEIRKVAAKENSDFWRRIARELSKSTRSRRNVNLSRIIKYSKAGETVIVPGKVLGTGVLTHEVHVAALNFSESAANKIKSRMTIKELLQKNPKGKNVRIIG